MKTTKAKPVKVEKALKRIGQQLRDARRRRRFPVALMAEKLGVTSNTWLSLEKGSPGIRLEAFINALMVFNRLDELINMLESDLIGLSLMDERLPKRIRNSDFSAKEQNHLTDSNRTEKTIKQKCNKENRANVVF